MKQTGFVTVSQIVSKVQVGDPKQNLIYIKEALEGETADLVVFPELTTTGYSCEDLFYRASLLRTADAELKAFIEQNTYPGVIILGTPVEIDHVLYNAAIAIQGTEILGIVPKMFLPHTSQFYETRWFQDGSNMNDYVTFLNQEVPMGHIVFESANFTFGIEVCADFWSPLNPSTALFLSGAEIVVNISSSPDEVGKYASRRMVANSLSLRNKGAYVYVSSGVYESVSHHVFGGDTFVSELGETISSNRNFSFDAPRYQTEIDVEAIRYQRRTNGWYKLASERHGTDVFGVSFISEEKEVELTRTFNMNPFIPSAETADLAFSEITDIQTSALRRRMEHIHTKKALIGVSGGLDSTLALLQIAETYKRAGWDTKDIVAVTLPSYPTSDRTKNNAVKLMDLLGITVREVPIHGLVDQQLELLEHDKKDVTYENIQARARTNFLFNLANKEGGMVVGTGDMTEMALGWATYAGDQYAHYGLNAGIPKTLVRWVVSEYAKRYPELSKVLTDIVETPISPELLLGQVTEETIGSYEIHDFILYRYLKYGDTKDRILRFLPEHKSEVEEFFKRFLRSQFKRFTMPESPKVVFASLSAHGDFRMVSDAKEA